MKSFSCGFHLLFTGGFPALEPTSGHTQEDDFVYHMKTSSIINCLTLVWLAGVLNTVAQVPGIITYQGRVTSHGTNFTGLGEFKFTLVRPNLIATTVWTARTRQIPFSPCR